MSKKPPPVVIPHGELAEGYRACIENAQELMRAAGILLDPLPAKALALAQVGQEELGKSFQILVAFTLPQEPDAWRQFWSDWRNHNRKAMAAYFYEWLNPVRIEIADPAGGRRTGMPLVEPIAAEKEIGLYVDYSATRRTFELPRDRVSGVDAFSRITTLLALMSTAVTIHDVLVAEDPAFGFPSFADIPAALVREFVPQERVPELYDALAHRSERHQALVDRLRSGYATSLEHLKAVQAHAQAR